MKNYAKLFGTALILLLITSGVIGLWIYVCADDSFATFDERKQAYLNYFPSWLQNARIISIINTALAAAAFGLFMILNIAEYKRAACIPLLILSALLFMWQVFSLM